MSTGKRGKGTFEVVRVFIACWVIGVFMLHIFDPMNDLEGVTFNLASLSVGATFVFVYDSKEQIRKAPLRFFVLFGLLLGLINCPFMLLLEAYFARTAVSSCVYPESVKAA